jgi:hypothetical protein
MAGTPFERSRTPLTTWFHVMFLFCASRNGVAAKEVQRQTGVTYKTAWRLCNEIRKYMGWVDGDGQLGGPGRPRVEVDKMFVGGYDKYGKDDKSAMLGIMERDGKITRVIPDRRKGSVIPEIHKTVVEGRVVTDEAYVFRMGLPAREREPQAGRICQERRSHQQHRSVLAKREAGDQRELRLGFEEALADLPSRVRVSP